MSDDIFMTHWVLLQTYTATDQYVAINKFNGQAWSFRTNDPKSEGWFHWLIVPTPDGKGYWLFNRLAQGESGECLTLPKGKNVFGQWKFIGEPRQTFELRRRNDNNIATLICQENHEALSTRWDAATFTWKYIADDDQQKLRIVKAVPLDLPSFPEIEGEPGALDRDLLQVESFEGGVPDETPRRVVGTELIAFPGVNDGQPIGDRMKYSPYYLLVRENYWALSFDEEYSGAGENEKTFEWEIGIQTTSLTSLEEVVNIQVGVDAAYKKGSKSGPGWSAGISASYQRGTTWRRTDSVERYERQKGKAVRRFQEGKRVRVACWHLVNLYTLKHRSGEVVGQIASIEPAIAVERAYPAIDAPVDVFSS